MRRALIIVTLVVLSAFSLQFFGCAASQKKAQEGTEQSTSEDYKEIEKLLGINSEEEKQKGGEEQQKAEGESAQKNDDLLKLLEADEGKAKSEARSEGEGTVADKRLARLQQQVKQLKKQLQQKNIQIAELKAKLAIKEEALKKYESGGAPARPAATPAPTSSFAAGSYEQKYQQALDLFHNRQYQQALNLFEELVATDSRHNLADNAQYWIGECYYGLGDYRAAILAFEKVFTFKQSNKNDYAQYKLGLCYYKLGDRNRARQEFQNMIDNYPDSPLVEKARKYLMQL